MSLSVGDRVVLDGEDVTEQIRSPRSTRPCRSWPPTPRCGPSSWRRQRAWVAAKGGGVVEGRDIGSVVLPEADLKIFLTADSAERAGRRAAEQGAAPDELAGHRRVDTPPRRARLESRRLAPSRRAGRRSCVDSTGRSVDSVVAEVLSQL